MHEEEVALVLVKGEYVEKSLGNHYPPLVHVPTDPNEPVKLRSLIDDSIIGMTTVGAIHTHIYSLARHMQELRDISETRKADLANTAEALKAASEASRAAAAEVVRLTSVFESLPDDPEHAAAEEALRVAEGEASRLETEANRLANALMALMAPTG
jgi:hypothetical protein